MESTSLLFVHDMILYIKDYIRKLFQLINAIIKIGYEKPHTDFYIFPIYTRNKHTEKKIRKTVLSQ